MEYATDPVPRMVDTQLTKMRWALGLYGLLSIAFGAVIIVWPNISLFALTIVFGAYAAVGGIVRLGAAFTGAAAGERGWLIATGLLGVAVGLLVLFSPGISALALLYVIGAYAVVFGIITIGGALWLPFDGGDTALLVLTGIIQIVFGILIFAKPGAGALAVLALIAAFAIVTGICELVIAIGGKNIFERGGDR